MILEEGSFPSGAQETQEPIGGYQAPRPAS